MKVGFEGIGHVVATFLTDTSATKGHPVVVSKNGTVKDCAKGKAPVGVLLGRRGDQAAVLLHGYVTLPYTGTTAPSLGWNDLVGDGTGGLTLAGEDETGRSLLVVTRDTTAKTMGLFL